MNATAEALKKKLGEDEVNPEILVLAICDRQLQTLDSPAATRVIGYLAAAHAWEGELDDIIELGRQVRSTSRSSKPASYAEMEKLGQLVKSLTSKLTAAQAAGQKSG